MVENRKQRNALLVLLMIVLLVALIAAFLWSVTGGEPYDYVAAKAEALGNDPGRIIAFVQDKVAGQDYEGCLRGPVGTLFSGAGNDVDRSALLVALLRKAGAEARFAWADTTWVQIAEGDKWKDLLTSGPAAATVTVRTGDDLPAEVFHTLTVTLRLTGQGLSDEASLVLRTAELATHPLLLGFSGGEAVLSVAGSDSVLRLPVNRAKDETLALVFTHQEPGKAKPAVFTREIYTRKYPDYPAADDPRNRYVITVAPWSLSRWAYEKERELTQAELKAFPDEHTRRGYLLVLAYMVESDEALAAMAKHFKAAAYFTRPRVIITSANFIKGSDLPASCAIDLRQNAVHVAGDETARAAIGVTRSAYEGSLEADILSRATGRPAISAFGALQQLFDRARPSTPQRLRFYASSLERLAKETTQGATLTFTAGQGRQVVFERGQGDELILKSISEVLTSAMEKAKVEWGVLKSKKLTAKDFGRAALELETLFGPVAGGSTDYRPTIDLEESTRELLVTDSRIFVMRKAWPDKPKIVTLEYQFLSVDGDIRYESIDYWDEPNKRPIDYSTTLRIPAKSVESSHVLSRYYSQGLYDKGNMFLMASREVHRELKEKGETTIRFMNWDGTLTDPIKLYLTDRKEATIYVNSRKRTIGVLYAAGGYVKDNPQKKPYEEVKPILVKDRWETNRWQILDNDLYPLIGIPGSRFQTALPGRVVSAATGLGIPDAKVVVEGTNAAGTTWGDGRFLLPVIRKRFGEFTVSASREGYAPRKVKINFTEPDAFPIILKLVPRPRPEDFVWVTAGEAEAELKKTEATDRVGDLVRAALSENPELAALVPKRRIALGGSFTQAWLLFDSANFQITGVTEDGLYGSSFGGGMVRDWASNGARAGLGMGGSPYETQTGVINYYSGFISSWYAYSAGKLDAISQMMDGKEFTDIGHAHAMKFAMDFLNGMSGLTEGVGGMAGRMAGFR
ncbi:MAG: hypothetical protein GWP05_01025, partial [Anaerolineaceae bacterium]|nr:hypothetical protein [Anaerolineaceae bacterium]